MKKILVSLLVFSLGIFCIGCPTNSGPLTPEQIQANLAAAQFILQVQQQLFDQWMTYMAAQTSKDVAKYTAELKARQDLINSLIAEVDKWASLLVKTDDPALVAQGKAVKVQMKATKADFKVDVKEVKKALKRGKSN